MNIIKINISLTSLILMLFSTLSFRGIAQARAKPEAELVIPPLFDLIDSALKHNALVRFRDMDIRAKEYKLKSERTNWTRNMGLQADTRYGTFDNYAYNNTGLSTSMLLTNSRQFNYGMGVYMKFPLSDLFDRKNQINRASYELEQAHSMADAQQDELRQEVIRLYHELLLKQRVLHIRSKALGSARVNQDMIEKEFQNGLIPVVEYVRVSDIVSNVEADYEKAKSEFISSRMILEDLAGFPFTAISN
jgi:outer membrane protein TolC